MKRLFYLVDSIDSVQDISDDLHEKGITNWRFHIVSKDEAGLYTHHLHGASVLERTDLVRFMERGAMIGAVFGLAFVWPMAVFSGLSWPMAAWVAIFFFFVVAGAWLGGFGGITGENYRIRRFHKDIEAGRYLVMVDTPKAHVAEMKSLMTKNHPEAELQGESTSFNNPFADKDGKSHVV